jgi:hypothetical protein
MRPQFDSTPCEHGVLGTRYCWACAHPEKTEPMPVPYRVSPSSELALFCTKCFCSFVPSIPTVTDRLGVRMHERNNPRNHPPQGE